MQQFKEFIPSQALHDQGQRSSHSYGHNGRTPELRHGSRNHRVDVYYWLLERINLDSSICIGYVQTTELLADILTKGAFTTVQWKLMMLLLDIHPPNLNVDHSFQNHLVLLFVRRLLSRCRTLWAVGLATRVYSPLGETQRSRRRAPQKTLKSRPCGNASDLISDKGVDAIRCGAQVPRPSQLILNAVARSPVVLTAEGDLLLEDDNFEVLMTGKCPMVSPIDSMLAKIHPASARDVRAIRNFERQVRLTIANKADQTPQKASTRNSSMAISWFVLILPPLNCWRR